MTENGVRHCSGRESAALSSSGGCMVGQIANVAAFRLAVGSTGRMPYLLAVAAGMPARSLERGRQRGRWPSTDVLRDTP